MFRYPGLPVYEGTKFIEGVDRIRKICVPSSLYAVVIHGNGELLSLLNLTSPCHFITPLHTNTVYREILGDLVAVTNARIAVTKGALISFYDISNDMLLESMADEIDLAAERLLGIDYHFDLLYVSSKGSRKIKQLNLKGNVLKTFDFNTGVYVFPQSFDIRSVSYNEVNKLIYFASDFASGRCLYTITHGGKTTQVQNMNGTTAITATETGDMYLARVDGLFMVSIDTNNAVKFDNPAFPHACITYKREQKKLYAACGGVIDIFKTNQSNM